MLYTRLIIFIFNVFKNYVFNNCHKAKGATSPYNLQNYKKIFIYALIKQELIFFISKNYIITKNNYHNNRAKI